MADEKGVKFEPPAASIRAQVESIVRARAVQIPRGFSNAVIRYETERGFSAAIVHRAGAHVEIVGWIGKAPGEQLRGGGEVAIIW